MSALGSTASGDRLQAASGERDGRDVLFAFFGGSWASSVERSQVMPEDRLALALLRDPGVRRLLVCDPYRSIAGKAAAQLRRRHEAAFPASPTRALHKPLRWRRTDPIDPRASVARYEAHLRRRAWRLGLRQPAVITASPLLAGFGDFSWAGPVTYYAWDDWTASEPHRRWWPAYAAAFERIRATGRRVCAVSEGALAAVAPTGPHAVIPNGVDAREWLEPGLVPSWFAGAPHPRLTYVGSLDGRVDARELEAIADAYPAGSITLVGPLLDPAHFAAVRRRPNVTIRPWADRDTITGLIFHSDACLIPHVRNDLTRSMSPLKLFEYLAGGRPVAAVDLPPIAAVQAPGLVLVRPEDSFVDAVAAALAIGPCEESERRGFVAANAWDRRFEELLGLALAPAAT